MLRLTSPCIAVVFAAHLLGCGFEPGAELPERDDTEARDDAAASCNPYAKRKKVPDVLVGPDDFEPTLLELIDGAESSIDVMIYQLSRPSIVTALAAAAGRGVAVRVLLDPDEGASASARAKLTGAGALVSEAPSSFSHAHAKVLIVDEEVAAILSGNLTYHTMVSERNYAVLDRAADDLVDLARVFEHDWSGAPLDLECTRLVVAPENARDRILHHVERAEDRLDLAVMYLSDPTVRAAVKARAAAGVPVRVLLASPWWMTSNDDVAEDLIEAGAEARFFTDEELHAKLVISDKSAFVGSENMSYTSLKKNREVGIFVNETQPFARIDAQFEADWAAGDLP